MIRFAQIKEMILRKIWGIVEKKLVKFGAVWTRILGIVEEIMKEVRQIFNKICESVCKNFVKNSDEI